MSDIKTIKAQAAIILQVMSANTLSEKDENEVILQVEHGLNTLQPFKLAKPYAKVSIRVHIKTS